MFNFAANFGLHDDASYPEPRVAVAREAMNRQVLAIAERVETKIMNERSANAVDRRVGQRVRARRLEIGMSQERLAAVLGITFQQVQKYENGTNRTAASRLFEIARALDVPIAYFFQGPGGQKDIEPDNVIGLSQVLATKEGVELVRMFALIKARRVRAQVVELVRALSDQ